MTTIVCVCTHTHREHDFITYTVYCSHKRHTAGHGDTCYWGGGGGGSQFMAPPAWASYTASLGQPGLCCENLLTSYFGAVYLYSPSIREKTLSAKKQLRVIFF